MICIYDQKIPRPIVEKLEKRGFLLLKTEKLNINTSLNTHPDIQVCKISNKEIVVEPSLLDYYEKNLKKYGIIVEIGSERVSEKYPKDTIYNLATNGKLAIHNFSITDKNLLKKIEEEKFLKINTKQGYSKCNLCFSKTGIITSDKGIYKSLASDLKKLLISPGNIDLEGYDYGFIGGASGYGDKLYFLGDIMKHPDYERIKTFLDEDNTEFEILNKEKLEDFGSLIFLEEERND